MCHLYWTFCHCCKKQIGQWKKSNICQGKDFHEVYCGEINVKKLTDAKNLCCFVKEKQNRATNTIKKFNIIILGTN